MGAGGSALVAALAELVAQYALQAIHSGFQQSEQSYPWSARAAADRGFAELQAALSPEATAKRLAAQVEARQRARSEEQQQKEAALARSLHLRSGKPREPGGGSWTYMTSSPAAHPSLPLPCDLRELRNMHVCIPSSPHLSSLLTSIPPLLLVHFALPGPSHCRFAVSTL
jgi:hypothetical protein